MERDVKLLYDAGQGKWGTDEGTLIKTLCGRPREYRNRLYQAYHTTHGKKLDDVMRGEMSGHAGKALANLVTPLGVLFARKLMEASVRPPAPSAWGTWARGLGLAGWANVPAVHANPSPALPSSLHPTRATPSAQAMKGLGTNDTDLIRIVCSQRGRHLSAAAKQFESSYSKSLSDWIASECSGSYKKVLLAVVQARGL